MYLCTCIIRMYIRMYVCLYDCKYVYLCVYACLYNVSAKKWIYMFVLKNAWLLHVCLFEVKSLSMYGKRIQNWLSDLLSGCRVFKYYCVYFCSAITCQNIHVDVAQGGSGGRRRPALLSTDRKWVCEGHVVWQKWWSNYETGFTVWGKYSQCSTIPIRCTHSSLKFYSILFYPIIFYSVIFRCALTCTAIFVLLYSWLDPIPTIHHPEFANDRPVPFLVLLWNGWRISSRGTERAIAYNDTITEETRLDTDDVNNFPASICMDIRLDTYGR